MTQTLPSAQSIAELVAPLRQHNPDPELFEGVYARVAWSVIAEPGDEYARALIFAHGHKEALRLVLAGEAAELFTSHRVTEAGPSVAMWEFRLSKGTVEETLRLSAEHNISAATPSDLGWEPSLLLNILYFQGSFDVVATLPQAVNVTGSRGVTSYGEYLIREFTADLEGRGTTVVTTAGYGSNVETVRSMLALKGRVIVAQASGLDTPVPSVHAPLLTRVAEQGGAVISEVPAGSQGTKARHIYRDRFIARAARATLVLEAQKDSSSVAIAREALEAGHPVGVVPGSVTSAQCAGSNELLRDKRATCVLAPRDFIELISM